MDRTEKTLNSIDKSLQSIADTLKKIEKRLYRPLLSIYDEVNQKDYVVGQNFKQEETGSVE